MPHLHRVVGVIFTDHIQIRGNGKKCGMGHKICGMGSEHKISVRNCGGPLFDVLQSACSYNTAIQQKMRPQRHKRKRSPRSEHSLTGYLHAGWAGGKGGPTDPPSRSKHKGFQKISRKKNEGSGSPGVCAGGARRAGTLRADARSSENTQSPKTQNR